MNTGSAIALVSLAVLINWIINLLKNATNKNWNGVVTQLAAAVAAFVGVVLYAHTRWATGIDLNQLVTLPTATPSVAPGGVINPITLADLGWAEQVLLAITLAAGGGLITDGLRTFNRSDTSVQLKLLPGPTETNAGDA